MAGYPPPLVEPGHVEPSPRRVRGFKDGRVVFDTVGALYLWEWPPYPQYVIPREDVDAAMLAGLEHRVIEEGPAAGAVRFAWEALDAWFEEDEQVFVHPRNPYSRVDAIRSSRAVRVARDGVVLAESAAPVIVFETGLPPRFYFERTAVDFRHLVASDTETACPYKGRTSAWWSLRIGDEVDPDIAWSYDFPTAALLPIAGLVAFYDERVDVTLDGRPRERPRTPFSR